MTEAYRVVFAILVGFVVVGAASGLSAAGPQSRWALTVGLLTYVSVLGICVGSHGGIAGLRFGIANWITLLRLVLVSWLGSMLVSVPYLSAITNWTLVLIAVVVLVLDGIDGLVARRSDTTSRFGARFDMEVDAALILVLALLAFYLEKAGSWVLLAGVARYLYIATGFLLSWLTRELPVSWRRKVVCVIQVATLVGCLLPIIGPPISAAVAAIGVIALIVSFAIDVLWCWQHRFDSK